MANTGLRPCRPGIARPRDRSPAAALPVDEDHVIELVDRLEAEDQRRIAVLLEHDRREERRLEAVRAAVADDAAEAAQRRAAARLVVVGQAVQIALHGERRAQPRDQPPLAAARAMNASRRDRITHRSVAHSPRASGPRAPARASTRCRCRS